MRAGTPTTHGYVPSDGSTRALDAAAAARVDPEERSVDAAGRRIVFARDGIVLRALPDGSMLNVEAAGNKMTVRAGRSRFNLQTMAAGDYPRISLGTEQLQTLSLPQKDLRGLFALAEFAMAQQDIRYYLNGMLLVVDQTSLQAVATDGQHGIVDVGEPDLASGADAWGEGR